MDSEQWLIEKGDPWKTCSRCKRVKSIYDFYKGASHCVDCTSIYSQKYREFHREEMAEHQRKCTQARKIETIAHYSNNKMICTKCGFSDMRALSIDHIYGGGGYHRKSDTTLGTNFYRWLKRNNYPEGYQVLCMNCQFIKRYENHEHA